MLHMANIGDLIYLQSKAPGGLGHTPDSSDIPFIA